MRAKKTIILTAAALMGACTLLTACGGSNAGGSDSKADSSESRENNALVGEWASEDFDGLFIYRFEKDGSGNYDAAGVQMPFKYVTEGDKLTVTYDGDTVPFETTYKVEGNKLTIKDSLDEDVVYNKK